MSTRSAIAVQHGDRIKAIYCHYDGYVEHHGVILQNFYNDSILANKLVSMGDASSLGATIGEKHSFSERATYTAIGGTEVANQCTFYNRDRDENTTWLSFDSTKAWTEEHGNWGCEYFYLFKNDKWFVKGRSGSWKLLSRVLANKGETNE